MHFFKFFAIRFCRFVASIFSQWFLCLIWGLIYCWNRFILPDKIHTFFGIEDLHSKLDLLVQSAKTIRSTANITHPNTYTNYINVLVEKAMLTSRLNLMQTFADISHFMLSGMIRLGLFCLAFYTAVRILRIYHQKTNQRESVRLITKALVSQLEILSQEIRTLRSELKEIKNAKNNVNDSAQSGC